MRLILLSAAALLASATAAFAEPASVTVAVGGKLQAKAEETYGVREISQLAESLRKDVERSLARTGAHPGARVELTLVDAVPNRPTFKQMSDQPSLSMSSFGVGGAKIEGRIVAPDGAVTPVAYRWYETDIRNWTWARSTWGDAEWTFDRFARKLSQGKVLAAR